MTAKNVDITCIHHYLDCIESPGLQTCIFNRLEICVTLSVPPLKSLFINIYRNLVSSDTEANKFADTKASLPAHDSDLAKIISGFLEITIMSKCLENKGLLISISALHTF